MKDELMNEILQCMLPYLDNGQLIVLKQNLNRVLEQCEISRTAQQTKEEDNISLISMFIESKRVEGCSDKTLKYYESTLVAMSSAIGVSVRRTRTEDLRAYLTQYQSRNQSSRVTIDNIRRILSSFFAWLEDEDYILKSPVRRIHKIKTATIIKETYTDEELETLRDNCDILRDLALIDLLASSGMRVGEIVQLNKDAINFAERECVVIGKGNKERVIYFDARTKLHLQEYIKSRKDNNPALFVTLRSPNSRLTIGGIEHRLRSIGKRLNMHKIHPHKFRRTMATMAIDKGMPIEQLQKLLGHQRVDTTLMYAMVKQSNIKNAHRKYIG